MYDDMFEPRKLMCMVIAISIILTLMFGANQILEFVLDYMEI